VRDEVMGQSGWEHVRLIMPCDFVAFSDLVSVFSRKSNKLAHVWRHMYLRSQPQP
jgi:hypothetical protein